MATEQFVAALTDYHLSPTEIAEVIWLALRQPQLETRDEDDLETEDETVAHQGDGDDHDSDHLEEDASRDEDAGGAEDDSAEEAPPFEIAPELPSGILPKRALPISVPDADILDETLPLIRAMKPLLKQIESQLESSVNEAKTVDRIAETDIWSPVLEPDQEPWFEVALVIDSSPAMQIWQRLIKDIQRFLRCYGSFRDFRVWRLAVNENTANENKVGICAVPDIEPVMQSPRALLTPDARRLILVFSDCTADYWWDGSLQPILALWGASTPTSLWQVLPDWMWKRTALGMGEYVAIRNHIPGARNTQLTPVFLSLRAAAERSRKRAALEAEVSTPAPICVPVITSGGEALMAWSQMLGGDRRSSSPGFLLPPPQANETEENFPQADLLETFRLRATPSARRLAALLSAAPVITLPVMRLIRASDERLPGSSPLPVAEVFLGGLLKKAPNQLDTDDPELVQYTFPDEVRDRLLDILPKVEAVDVVEAVSKYVAQRLGYSLADFRALLLSPDLRGEADRHGLRSFARMTAHILKKKGPEFAALVRQLEGTPDPGGDGSEGDTDDWLAGFTHATLTYQVAEYLNFPAIEPFSFDQVELVDGESFPPPLSTEDFTIRTLERQGTIQLESFEITIVTIATLVKVKRRWQLERELAQAQRFIEPLPDDLTLEMVAIPGGHFIMGSPPGETGRLDHESPQHKVTVDPFFMGRYPITQTQWRVVAALPRVKQDLDPAPSRFKGDLLPVEGVSWNDAVEFCARLSAHTGREYRLPTEAQWEYACRATTTTAFHFGEVIAPEVANYNGSSAYSKGLEGEYRQRTTPVDHFGLANAYGLSDMHGNVWEWCADHWHGNYEGAPTDGSAWLTDGKSAARVRRGGSWLNDPGDCRSASRDDFLNPDDRNDLIGFRVSCAAPRALQ